MRSSTKAVLALVGGVAGADYGQDTFWCKCADRR